MKVLRINMTVVSGKDVTPESTKFNLERILGQDTIQDISLPEPDIKGERKGEFESPKTTSQQFHVKEIFSTPRIPPD